MSKELGFSAIQGLDPKDTKSMYDAWSASAQNIHIKLEAIADQYSRLAAQKRKILKDMETLESMCLDSWLDAGIYTEEDY